MTYLEAYTHIQQGLQTISAFDYRNIELKELDYFWDIATDKFIKLAFPDVYDDNRQNEKYSDIESSLDDLRVLEVLGYTSTLTAFNLHGYSGSYLTLPDNYRHLLADSTQVLAINCSNSDNTRVYPNRLVKTDILYNSLSNSIYKSHIESPVSHLSANKLYVYNTYRNQTEFGIEKVYIDYIKKPIKADFGVDGSGVIEFPENVCFKIIQVCLIYISIVAEQNPNKIQLLTQ